MGGAPSRETLVRHIVRDPRQEQLEAAVAAGSASGGSSEATLALTNATSQQAEIILIPLIPDYFPSSTSPLFQQLVHVRREPTVSYYYRDARSTATEHAVVHGPGGSDKELYNWYMSLSEQRLMETDNELIALSRAGRVVSPVPCAVAFVYNATVTSAATAAAAAAATTATAAAAGAEASEEAAGGTAQSRKKDGGKGKQNRRGKANTAAVNNGYMTIENTVRVPHHNLRVRIFGFVGDTRFCPPSMQPSQAAKLPMCFTIFLSKSAGGNHRAQVTLLAAHTYMKQLQHIGVLHHIDSAGGALLGGGAQSQVGSMSTTKMPASPVSVAAVSMSDMDPLAGLRGGGQLTSSSSGFGAAASATAASATAATGLGVADPYRDPYADPYAVDDHADPYAIRDDSDGPYTSPPPPEHSMPHAGSNVPLDGLGCGTPSPAVDAAKEIILRRPLELLMHRADVPALCYVRELRARMDQDAMAVLNVPSHASMAAIDHYNDVEDEMNASATGATAADPGRLKRRSPAAQTTTTTGGGNVGDPHTLKRHLQTVIRDEELRGFIDAESMGHVLLWASRFYAVHYERLVGGEAAKLRQELAQRNLSENPLDGTLSLTEDEPRPPKVIPATGDVWIAPHDTYVEVRHYPAATASAALGSGGGGSHLLHGETENWKTVQAGAVLRYAAASSVTAAAAAAVAVPKVHQRAVAAEASAAASAGAWEISPDEFAEDILLSLCRHACQASRRAPATDEHWLLNRETGLPEGLQAGLLIWRELAAGQTVYYGTTPEFLKQWVQSGAELESAYRNQVKKTHHSSAAATVAGVAEGERGAGSGVAPSPDRHSTSITVTGASAATVVSKGLHSSYDNNSPANQSGVSSGPRLGSSKEKSKGSGSSSLAVYGAHAGFVGAAAQDSDSPAGTTKADAPSPNSKALAMMASQGGSGGGGSSSTEARRIKASRGRGEDGATPTAVMPTGASDAAEAASRETRSDVVVVANSRETTVRPSRSLPAHHQSHFAVPVASSGSLARTPNSSTSSISSGAQSYSDLGYVDRLSTLHGSGSSSPIRRVGNVAGGYPTTPLQPQSERMSSVNLATACWIGPPDATSHDGRNTPTVNVVVKQRRSVRLTPGTSLLDTAGLAATASSARYTHVSSPHFSGSGSYTRGQARSDVPSLVFSNPATQAVPVRGGAAGRGGTVAGAAGMAAGSLPIHIFGAGEASSDEASFHMGGHSPSSQEQSRSLLRGDNALLSHSLSRGGHDGAARLQQSSAMAVRPRGGANGVGTPVDGGSLRWSTSNVAQPSSMRGASVTFASGSARHGTLLHSSHYHEPCQPVLSRPASVSNAELLGTSASSSGSSSSRKKEAMRPPPLFSGEQLDARAPGDPSYLSANTRTGPSAASGWQRSPDGRAPGEYVRVTVPATTPLSVSRAQAENEPIRPSPNSSGVHTPRVEAFGDSAKSSVGSGKYRWDWRGVSWNA